MVATPLLNSGDHLYTGVQRSTAQHRDLPWWTGRLIVNLLGAPRFRNDRIAAAVGSGAAKRVFRRSIPTLRRWGRTT